MGNSQSSASAEGITWSDACSTCDNPCAHHTALGFEPRGGPLVGTVKPFGMHVVISSEKSDWPARIETESGSAAWHLQHNLNALEKALGKSVLVTYSELAPDQFGTLELLIFPDALRISAPGIDALPSAVAYLIGLRKASAGQTQAPVPVPDGITVVPLTKAYVFVCTHRRRNERCGMAGPPIIDAFRESLERRGIDDKVVVAGSSHFGGHKYAGVVIVYPSGDWYGRLRPCDVDVLVNEHIVHGRVLREHWRGRNGLTAPAKDLY